MRVIGAGFGRTGTTSLSYALDRLGFGPCYHMKELATHPEHIPFWVAAYEGGPVDWDELFSAYASTTDWPACSFTEQLIVAYPDAKVILTTRDPERWYDSVQATFLQIWDLESGRAPEGMPPGFTQLLKGITNHFPDGVDDRAHAIEVFRKHNERIRALVPAERLLVLEIGQGWQPLCDFLGVAVPAEPFPRVNDREQFTHMVAEYSQPKQ